MAGKDGLASQITRDKLISLMRIHGECDEYDVKETIDLKSKRSRAELARDVLAFMNTEGGGHIVFGVRDKTFEPVGLDPNIELDTTKLYNALTGYIDGALPVLVGDYEIHDSEIGDSEWGEGRRFAIVFIDRRPGIARPKAEVAFPDDAGRMVPVLHERDVYVRRGGQSVLANAADMNRLAPPPPDADHEDIEHDLQMPLITRLPAAEEIATRFVGRRGELEQLHDWLADPQSRIRLLAGDGGKGKSAIAFQFATIEVVNPQAGLEGALWVSAKRRRFVEGATRPIQAPDFWNLESLLDAIARGYGFEEYTKLPLAEKRQSVVELLTDLPILLIADDIDSLDDTGDDAFMFLISDTMQTHSKVLLTSRDVKFGLNGMTIQVAGFTDEDGEAFIKSRIQIFGLDPGAFTARVMREIMQATDGSPLYIEDLMRLCAIFPIRDAIDRWRERSGDAAREYALMCEFDRLPDVAKRIVIAACLNDGPTSFVELQSITGLTDQEMENGIARLQKLFLVSKPRLIEGVERFDVNLNTRRLVLKTQERNRPELVRQLTEAHRQVTSSADVVGGREIGSYIRQAISLQSLGRDNDAESSIRAALVLHPDNASLIAQLGIIAARRRPSRPAEAREHFRRAAQLKCRRETMYLHWAHMEEIDEEWTAALSAVKQGLANVGNTVPLLNEAGYAHSRWGQQLLREFHFERGTKELHEAIACYQQALRRPKDLEGEEESQFNGRILRGITLAYEALCRVDRTYVRDAHHWSMRYRSEHPNDTRSQELAERIATKYPLESHLGQSGH